VAPVTIVHPALFQPKPDAAAVAAARAAEADEAARKADQARSAAMRATREAAKARVPVRIVENLKLRAEAQLAAAESEATYAASAEAKEQAEAAKAKTAANIAELTERLAAAKAELLAKLDAVGPSREAVVAAEAARVAAEEAQRKVARNLEPVSIFISRKTQRLYVRQAFQPVLEIPVTVQDADRSIGTHVFTAVERTGNIEIQWRVVSLVGGLSDGSVPNHATPRRGRVGDAEPISTDSGGAKEALDRIAIPQDTLDRIAELVSPRSSLIISDEALSSETGNGTEFVVLLSGEPQGGIKNRRRGAEVAVRYWRPSGFPYWRSPFASPYFTW
jgi:hypothetical protein